MVEAGYKIFQNLLVYTENMFNSHRNELKDLVIKGM